MEAEMKESNQIPPEIDRINGEPGIPDTTWLQTITGAFPFAVIGFGAAMIESPYSWACNDLLRGVGGLFLFGGFLLIVAGFGIGWFNHFPRWVFPYIFYNVIFSLYLSNASTPGLQIFGFEIFGRELWGWRAWVPLLLAALIVLLITRFSTQPWVQLGKTTWNDWTQLSFGLYGVMPLVLFIGFDEVDNSYQFPYMVGLALVIIVGALVYMRSPGTKGRVLSLFLCTTISLLILAFGLAYYWNGRVEPWMVGEPDRWVDVIQWNFIMDGILLAILFSPGLIGLLRKIISTKRVTRGM
jgi:hypothetical protein